MLDSAENIRYNRHLILDEVGMAGQLKLKAAKVLVIGAGGLGCPVLQYLAAAGIGKIGIVDFDVVDLSNLQRQILFTTEDIGKNKAETAARRLKQLNPHVVFEVYPTRLTTKNALTLFEGYDLVVDGSDNFSTRYLVNDAALLTGKPLVYGSIYTFQGQVSVFNYQNGPSYRCLFPVPPHANTVKNCSEIGVLGVLPGIIGTHQANEALKIILGIGEPLSGKLWIFDALKTSVTTVAFNRSETEIETVLSRKADFETFDYDFFCGISTEINPYEITADQFQTFLNQEEVRIIDLREEWEEPSLEADNVERITMTELQAKLYRFKTTKKVILACQTGMRSKNVRILLNEAYGLNNIYELKGGMETYE